LSRLDDIGLNFENIPSILEEYEHALKDVEEHLNLKGKKLEHANRENPAYHVYYDQRRIELHTIVKYMELRVSKTRGKLFRSFTEAYQRDLSDRAKDKYIDSEEAYLTIYEIYLEVKELYDKYQAVCDAFTTRGYALNNITKIRVASMEDATI